MSSTVADQLTLTGATANASQAAGEKTYMRLNGADIASVVLYFIFVLAVGFFAMCRSNRGTVNGYFLAGRSMIWPMVGASLFVSNIGSEHFIGLAGSGAAIGIATAAWEVIALVTLQMLGFLFVPVYIACGVVTMPEYLSKRFGGRRLRVIVANLSLLLYVVTKVSVNLYAGGLFIQQSIGWNIYVSMIALILLTALLTITGGLTAVIYTDTLQAILMVTGATALTILSFMRVGGYQKMKEEYMKSIPDTTLNGQTPQHCGVPYNDSFIMLREPSDENMPWIGFLVGQCTATLWYWCTDQVIVQRALASKSLSHAQGATLFAGFIKILPMFIMVMPGMISRILYTNEVACVKPEVCKSVCGSATGCTNIAFPRLVLGVMPEGARGLMMSVMIAALMSDLDSIFNSASTIFTMDIWKRVIRTKASVHELMIVGRVWVVVMVGLSIAWVPILLSLQGGQLFLSIQEMSGYLAPPIAGVFVIGMFWTRCNEKGAFYGLICGIVLGLFRMVLVVAYRGQAGSCLIPDERPQWYRTIIGDVHFMYYAFVLFSVTIIVAAIVSLSTERPEHEMGRVTWWTRHPPEHFLDCELVQLDNKQKENQQETEEDKEDYIVKSAFRKGCEWFCGYNRTADETDEDISKITSLKQDPKAVLLLRCLLVVVLLTAVFIFVFFSIN